MEETREHQIFHVGLKAFISQGKKLLVLQDDEGRWELPGGRIEKREIFSSLEKSLCREVAEELGVDFKYEVGSVFQAWIRKPEFGPNSLHAAEYKDQDLCIFLVGIFCKYQKGEPNLSPEHHSFKWITKVDIDTLDFENTYKDAIKNFFQHLEK